MLQHLNFFFNPKFIFTRLQKLYLDLRASFRQGFDVVKCNSNSFDFRFEDGCKCSYSDGPTLEIEHDLLDHPPVLYDSQLLRGFENGSKFS